jgi:hypothetical protein
MSRGATSLADLSIPRARASLGTLGGCCSDAYAANASGEVVGFSGNAFLYHVLYYSIKRDLMSSVGIMQRSFLPNQRYRFRAIRSYNGSRSMRGMTRNILNVRQGGFSALAISRAASLRM